MNATTTLSIPQALARIRSLAAGTVAMLLDAQDECRSLLGLEPAPTPDAAPTTVGVVSLIRTTLADTVEVFGQVNQAVAALCGTVSPVAPPADADAEKVRPVPTPAPAIPTWDEVGGEIDEEARYTLAVAEAEKADREWAEQEANFRKAEAEREARVAAEVFGAETADAEPIVVPAGEPGDTTTGEPEPERLPGSDDDEAATDAPGDDETLSPARDEAAEAAHEPATHEVAANALAADPDLAHVPLATPVVTDPSGLYTRRTRQSGPQAGSYYYRAARPAELTAGARLWAKSPGGGWHEVEYQPPAGAAA